MWHSVIPTDIIAGPKAYNIQPSMPTGKKKHACAINSSRSVTVTHPGTIRGSTKFNFSFLGEIMAITRHNTTVGRSVGY